MNKQTNIEVIINGKRYTLSGLESEEHMQKVASHINRKYDEFKAQPYYKTMDAEMRNVLMQINLSDDYLKLKEQMQEKDNDSDSKSNEIFELKHEIISLQTRILALEKELEEAKNQHHEDEKNMVRLETELAEARKKKIR